MKRVWQLTMLFPALATSSVLIAAQQAQTVTNTELKAQPEPKAKTVAQLGNGSALVVGERQGGWYAAETTQGKGWVRLLHVRLAGVAPATSKDGTSALITLGSVSRTDTTVATGIRGLTAEELQDAKENPRELAKLDAFAVNEKEARRFAADGAVSSRSGGED